MKRLEEFEQALLTYGSDFERWPSALRQAGEKFVALDEHARALHEEAWRLDTMVREVSRPMRQSGDVNAILRHVSERRRQNWFTGILQAIPTMETALGAAAVFGIVCGAAAAIYGNQLIGDSGLDIAMDANFLLLVM